MGAVGASEKLSGVWDWLFWFVVWGGGSPTTSADYGASGVCGMWRMGESWGWMVRCGLVLDFVGLVCGLVGWVCDVVFLLLGL